MNSKNIEISIIESLNEQMVEVLKGEITLNDDRIKRKWTVEVQPFLMSKYLVTQELYFVVTNESPSLFIGKQKPTETLSWKEAVSFCNSISTKQGLESCYLFNDNNEKITFNNQAKWL